MPQPSVLIGEHPVTVPAYPVAWWESDWGVYTASSVIAKNGDDAYTWKNRGSGGNDFAGGNKGKFQTGIFGTMPGLTFDGTIPQGMSSTLSLSNPCTIIGVGKLTGTLNQRLISSNTNNWLLGWWSGDEDTGYAGGFVGPGNVATTNIRCYTMTLEPALGSLYSKKSLFPANNTNAINAPTSLAIGSNGFGEPASGSVAALIAYAKVLSLAEISYVVDYLVAKYNVA
jgi:hypothetical protein